ncbi:MAG TPA: hypothetical protein VHC97_12785 [Thermoanaerobaculia bacterium]|jgi:hypothetical protein|nr:hypothetical protein [Thermoanaerobaculia bacterium]
MQFLGSYSSGGSQPERHFFRYVGRTSLTVAGPVSGKYYRFSAPGATVEADPGDAPSLEQVRQLRRV